MGNSSSAPAPASYMSSRDDEGDVCEQTLNSIIDNFILTEILWSLRFIILKSVEANRFDLLESYEFKITEKQRKFRIKYVRGEPIKFDIHKYQEITTEIGKEMKELRNDFLRDIGLDS
jgi:hypothetical protein